MNAARRIRSGRGLGRLSIGLRIVALLAIAAAVGPVAGIQASSTAAKAAAFTPAPPLAPIDPQNWQDQQTMTWDDYKPIPGITPWATSGATPTARSLSVALEAVDFPDQPFVITEPKKSDAFGNPQIDPIPRSQVPQFYKDFFGTPSALNHNQTLNGYWMEQSGGKVGISSITPYGPYLMPRRLYQYGLNDIGQPDVVDNHCPSFTTVTGTQTATSNLAVASSSFYYSGDVITFSAISPTGTKTVTAVPDSTHIVLASTTTSQAMVVGQTAVRVASLTGLAAGHAITIGASNGQNPDLESATIAQVGTGTTSTTLSTASAASATNIKVASVTGFTAGQTIFVDTGASIQTAVIAAGGVGTAGAGGTGLTLNAPGLSLAHAGSAAVSGLGIILSAPLTLAHPTGRPVGDPLSTAAVTSVANGATIQDCTFGNSLETDAAAALQANAGCTSPCGASVALRIYAGYDETSVWQEFGEMMFQTQDDIPQAVWGNPNPLLPNWVRSRYVPWTSWYAGSQLWGQSSIRQGESSGTLTHEMSHFFFSIGDNNNNPYATPYHRVGSGPWDMMDRGSFNGPGGPHNRWEVPAQYGASMGAEHDLRNKIGMGFVPNSRVLRLNRNGLASSGLAVADIVARAVNATPVSSGNVLSGVQVYFDGSSPIDKEPACNVNTDPLCDGGGPSGAWNNYTVETVQRIGYGSFEPDSGVLIAKNKAYPSTGTPGQGGTSSEGSTCGYSCFTWVEDAHPEDMNYVDYYKPDGTPIMRTVGDYRQLDDALFHAGTNSGSQSEYVDGPNNLRIYVISKYTDATGYLHYIVGVQNPSGAGPQVRGVSVADAPAQSTTGSFTNCTFAVTNSGTDAATSPSLHPQDETAFLHNDIYRLSAAAIGAGWSAQLSNTLATAKFGDTVSVPVYVTRTAGSASAATVQLTATSVSDTSKVATGSCAVSVQKPTVGSTLDPASPTGANGWYTGDVSLTWQVTDADTTTGCDDRTFTTDGVFVTTCSATSDGGTTSATVTVKRDATKPATSSILSPAAPTGSNGWYLGPVLVTLTGTDATSGVASTQYAIDGGAAATYSGPFTVTGDGSHTVQYWSTDNAGNAEAASSFTVKVDLHDPTGSAAISPAEQNGWYASPTVTITGDDGPGGSGIARIEYSVDGGPWTLYTGPLTGFASRNYAVQYRETDFAGRQSSVGLIAFKADSGKPSVNITAPADGASYPLDKVVTAKFKCTDNESGIATCVGTVANGANLDTSTVGTHTFTVTGTDKAGNTTTVTHHYTVTYTWNGFFSPISNDADSQLNLVHAGDLIKIGFGLNGDRGLGVLSSATSTPVACPSWAPHTVPAGGAGTTAGLTYGTASGHYTYGWQTDPAWAGTCRRFDLQLNDGSIAHSATFMFFA